MNYDSLFVNPTGRTPRSQFVPALLVLVAVVLFFAFVVKGRTATFCMLVLMYPGLILHARRLHDMGRSAWLLAAPALLLLAAFVVWFKYASFGTSADTALPMAALLVAATFALWGTLGSSR
jgi:uncharacterized membrane protein YhaH (DUF805 family)